MICQSEHTNPLYYQILPACSRLPISFLCSSVRARLLFLAPLNDKSLFEKEGKATQKREAVKKAKKANPRKIELVCLKNRYGTPSFSCYFDYYAAYDLMTKCTKLDFEQEYETPKAGRTI